ncbi:recombination related exonuclease [Salmonella phage STG2]|uniref:Recombination related exonuclease n=1 Tax=Salmonella phage STG2 TaxID=2480623 RepID=A0A3G2KAM6_9CAUD|nr:tRNA amidotransferase [Salmonella phage STG2]AYN56036.1 recombination related exonuclease [Salmonella phage STG2]
MEENILDVLRRALQESKVDGSDKEVAKSYQTIIGDLQRVDKDFITSEQFVSYLKAQLKSINQTKAKLHGQDPDNYSLQSAQYEYILNKWLQQYLPPQLSDSEIRKYFAELVKLNPGITKGMLMRAIKEEFPGRYDGGIAAQVAGEFNKN